MNTEWVLDLELFMKVCTRWALGLDILYMWILGEYWTYKIFINVYTKWAFHLELLTKNDWTKSSKLCDQMGLDKITSKWMFNLCRWKINQNESNHWSHLLVQLSEIHTTQDFVLSWELPAFIDQAISALCSKQCHAISNHHANQGKKNLWAI